MNRLLPAILILLTATALPASAITAGADSAAGTSDSVPRRNLIQRVIAYFGEANKVRERGKFDISFVGGPHYSSDSKFGIGLLAAGTYNLDKTDSLDLLRSNVAITGDATTAGHFKVGLEGENIFPGDRSRLTYDIEFSSIKTKYWGIGYDLCHDDANESDYRYLAVEADISHTWRVGRNMYVGPMLTVNYTSGRHFDRPEIWGGEPTHAFAWGPGVTLRFDTRDNLTDPRRGAAVRLDQLLCGRWLGNSRGFNINELTASIYRGLWRGGTLAARLHWRLTWGDTPWCFLSTIGGSHDMRGYFEGRYRDKNVMDICVELRQHVWRRNGMVAWVGAASLFPRFSAIRARQVLPNAGIGYRWEFKRRMNVRLDLGFGRHQTGFIIGVNEAF